MEIINIKKEYSFSFKNLFTKDCKTYEKKQLEKTAQLFLDSNNYDAYFSMISEGYQPTQKQSTLIDRHISNLLSTNPSDMKLFLNFYDVENYLKKGLKLNYENVSKLLLNNNFSLHLSFIHFLSTEDCMITLEVEDGHRESFAILSNEVRNIIKQDGFSDFLLNLFKRKLIMPRQYLFNQDFVNSYYEDILNEFYSILQIIPEILFKNLSFKNFLLINKKLQKKNISNSNKNTLNNIVNNFYKNDMKSILNNTKINYTSERLANLTMKTIKNENYNVNDLSTGAVELIKSIEDVYKKIKALQLQPSNKIYSHQIEQLDNLLDKRIPEVLSKYLTIDPSYRTTLISSQGKNAEQLMIESLDNIKQSFTKVFEDINQDSVNSLSVTNRYTQALIG